MTKTSYERRWLILAVVLAAECMDLLDSTIVNVAAPKIHAELHTSSTSLQWIVGGYSLAIAVGLITGGRLGDLFGRRNMFIVGCLGFTVFSAACGFAPNTTSLIVFRILQGLASSVMLPQGFGVIREVFPPEEIQKAFGIFGPVIGSAAVVGPILGGALVAWNLFGTGWRLVFFINLPIGVAAVIGAALMLPANRRNNEAKLDLVGTFLTMSGGFTLIYPLIEGREHGWPAWTYLMIAGSLVLFAVFGVQQRARTKRNVDPLVLTSIFSHRGFSGGLLVMLVFFAGMGGLLLTVSVFLQVGQGFTAVHAGATFIPMSIGLALGAGLSGGLLGPKYGRKVIQGGGVISLIGWLVVLITLHVHAGVVGFVALLPGLLIAGFGMGLCVAPLFDIVLAAVTDEETGSGSGVLNAVQQLASAIGVAVLGTIFFSDLTAHGSFRRALERTLVIQAGSLAAMLLLSMLLPRMAREEGQLPLASGTVESTAVALNG